MPTSRKRTKKRRKIRFPVLILGICLICALILLICGLVLRGCRNEEEKIPDSDSDAVSVTGLPEVSDGDFSMFVGHKVLVPEETVLYEVSDGTAQPAGTVSAGALLDIDGSLNGGYLTVADSPFCIAMVRKCELTSSLAGSPNDMLDTPRLE